MGPLPQWKSRLDCETAKKTLRAGLKEYRQIKGLQYRVLQETSPHVRCEYGTHFFCSARHWLTHATRLAV